MEAAFYYLVRVKLIRFIKDDNIDFISDEKEFIDKSPIKAREKALDYYNSYIDTLLEPNLSHKEVRALLSERIKGADKPYEFDHISNDEELYIPPSMSKRIGIGVFLKFTQPEGGEREGEEHLIHGVGFSLFGTNLSIMDSLNLEINYYNDFGYDKDDQEISLRFYNEEDDEIYDEVILKTPFDWTGLDKPQDDNFEEEKGESIGIKPNELSVAELAEILIHKGEGKMIEFKPSLQSYERDGKVVFGKFNRFEILRTIAAFLNSKGGFLLVGVSDIGKLLGLDNDFSLSGDNSDNPKDYFKIQVDYIVKNNFKALASNISGEFVNLDGKEIYFFRVKPSAQPVFVLNDTENSVNPQKQFYVRMTGASSIHYYDIEDIVGYCLNHWGKSS
ncbi:AlbA family DNA-binding domain-containing protein [Autumnicola psychrophila]|uniref:ATP-binding protein n=1 Tax=Autumnicola psychrophila TaxID=3075592 RepID=A0ABU3DPE8_9FLAO|nr:ATP-binding protein [Zunongwangia sp. F225]MDT0685566.1 ATP-binding protein [Zunongwangia sp. F225]